MQRKLARWAGPALGLLLILAALWLIFAVYTAGHPLIAVLFLVILGASTWLLSHPKLYPWRYLYPGVFAALLFVVFPAAYTVSIGFTNYSSTNLLTFERATKYFLDQTYSGAGDSGGDSLAMGVYPDGGKKRVYLSDDAGHGWQSDALDIDKPTGKARDVELKATAQAPAGAKAQIRDLIAMQGALKELHMKVPEHAGVYQMAGFSRAAPAAPLFQQLDKGTLKNLQSGEILKANFRTGYYETASGDKVSPGFTVGVGGANFAQLFTSKQFRGPLLAIFTWTVGFALATVILTFAVGFLLAVALSWESLAMRGLYRVLLFLPYAVPGFISILIFRGLFNENFGEINLVLHSLFGIKPDWFSNPWLARGMLLIVNTWLGYPYMMLLCMGLIKSIPSELYEASAIHGGGAWTNLRRITLPLIAKPIMPLLLASFAFNFNNFVLISLLTAGGPDFPDSLTPAGSTDILVSYTYRIAFQDSGQNFGLAAAISTVIFILVGVLSLINLKLTRVNQSTERK
ncbi:maltose ABC transporter permease MalF [Amantichitinum ursilacus]|uniref:Maltose/maltodextrin transport system permease protein n=1 Tax=Amantichitinum ursilacus TaxID=857265 RepID=A0A0N0XIK1_9NEIS|nr:maltose ABC transporter permease MalF [Amantichitinum ursilacus]KPC52328.1 Maltose transport system permease protein MalF [Amantichitinum ursilacus]